MSTPTLHYYYDPLCGWCYAAAPLVSAAAGSGIPFELHGGGLWDTPQPYPAGMVARIRESESRIAAMTGQVYGDAYVSGLLVDPGTILHSLPPIAAILAADAQEEGAGLSMLHALQKAHFVDGRRIVEHAVLMAIAAESGLDVVAFGREIEAGSTAEHVARTRAAMSMLGMRGFPGFVLLRDSGPVRIDHQPYYADPAGFVGEIERHIRGVEHVRG